MQIDVPIRKGAIAGEVAAAHTYWSMVRALGSPPTNRVVAFADDVQGREEGQVQGHSMSVSPIRVMDGCYSHALMHSLSPFT